MRWKLLAFCAALSAVVSARAAAGSSLEPVMTMSGQRAPTNVGILPDGSAAVSVGYDGSLRWWDLGSGKLQRTIQLSDSELYGLALSEQGMIAATGAEGRLFLSDRRGKKISSHPLSSGACLSVAFVDEETVAVGCADLKVRLVSTRSGKVLRSIQARGQVQYDVVQSIAVDMEHATVLSSSPTVVTSLTSGREVLKLKKVGYAVRMRVAPGGERVAGAAWIGGVKLFSPSVDVDPQVIHTYGDRIILSPDDKEESVQVEYPALSVAWSPDGHELAVGDAGAQVKVWRVAVPNGTPEQVYSLAGPTRAVTGLAWSGDGKTIVGCSLENSIFVWRLP